MVEQKREIFHLAFLRQFGRSLKVRAPSEEEAAIASFLAQQQEVKYAGKAT